MSARSHLSNLLSYLIQYLISSRPSDMYMSANETNIDSNNYLSLNQRQAIIWSNAGLLFIGPLRTNFSEIQGKNLKLSSRCSAKWQLSQPKCVDPWCVIHHSIQYCVIMDHVIMVLYCGEILCKWHGRGTLCARPNNDNSIEFQIQPKFAVHWFKMYSTNHNKILHTSRQCNCRDVCKILLWSVKHILN